MNAAFRLTDMIGARWTALTKIRLVLISNQVISSRVDGLESQEIDGVPVTQSVWDLSRLHRFSTWSRPRRSVFIDLENALGDRSLLYLHTWTTRAMSHTCWSCRATS